MHTAQARIFAHLSSRRLCSSFSSHLFVCFSCCCFRSMTMWRASGRTAASTSSCRATRRTAAPRTRRRRRRKRRDSTLPRKQSRPSDRSAYGAQRSTAQKVKRTSMGPSLGIYHPFARITHIVHSCVTQLQILTWCTPVLIMAVLFHHAHALFRFNCNDKHGCLLFKK